MVKRLKGDGVLSRIAAVAVGAAILVAPAAIADGAQATAKPLILSPSDDNAVPARPLLIRVRAGRHVTRFRAQLNGHPIARLHFSRPSNRGVRTLRASPTFGLRHGLNRLQVRIRRANGRVRTERERFRVRRNRPLAAAGFDERVAAGAKVYLDGGRSRSHLGDRRDGAGLRHRWSVVRAPKAAPRKLNLSGLDRRRPTIRPEVPGHYRLRLTVRASDGEVSSDVTDVQVDPPPAVPINTMVFRDNALWGVRVGADYYLAGGNSAGQLVALDRSTLEPVSGDLADLANKTYAANADDQIKDDLKRLDEDQIAIVSTQPYSNSFFLNFQQQLDRLGISPDAYCNPSCPGGSFSAIGVPGVPAEAYWHHAGGGGPSGRIEGLLIRNTNREYEFASSDRTAFNTRPASSNDQRSVVQVGDQSFSSDIPPGSNGGFQVVVIDPATLQGSSQFFDTSAPCGAGAQPLGGQLQGMTETLEQALRGPGNSDYWARLVFIVGRGQTNVQACGNSSDQARINDLLRDVTDSSEALGGTRQAMLGYALDPAALPQHHWSYTLIGSSLDAQGIGPGRGEEAVVDGPAGSPGHSAAPISGTLARTNPHYRFELTGSPVIGEAGASATVDLSQGARALTEVAFQQPGNWPEQGDRNRTRAVAYVSQQAFGTDDPRAEYWTQPYATYDWKEAKDRIDRAPFKTRQGFTEDDLAWAKAELKQEIDWLRWSHAYLKNLAEPFKQGELESFAQLEGIADTIRDNVGVSSDAQTFAREQAFFDAGRELLEAVTVPELYVAATAFNTAYDTGMKFVQINRKPAEDPYQARADQVAVDLVTRLDGAQDALTGRLADLIAADYEKLRTVGACASPDPAQWSACPFDHREWQFTEDDQAFARQQLKPAMRIWAYSALLPARYSLFELPIWWATKVNDEFAAPTPFLVYPFDGLPDTAQMSKPQYRNIGTYSHQVSKDGNGIWHSGGEAWSIYALGFLSGSGRDPDDPWVMHVPTAAVTDPLFKPVSAGGLGVYPERFFDRYFKPTPLTRYPYTGVGVGWCPTPDFNCY